MSHSFHDIKLILLISEARRRKRAYYFESMLQLIVEELKLFEIDYGSL